MSRIWKQPVVIPDWVTVTFDWWVVKVSWPKGNLEEVIRPEIWVEIKDWTVVVTMKDDSLKTKWFYWLSRTLIQNMVIWVTKWYEKQLQIIWVWFNVQVQGAKLKLNLWFSHPVELDIWPWLTIELDKKEKNLMTISWASKQQVWEYAAQVRKLKKPEPYKWKWIRYKDEYVRRKAWKAAAK